MYESDREAGVERGEAVIRAASSLIRGKAAGIQLGIHTFLFQFHP